MREHGQQPQPKMSTVTRQLDLPNYFWTRPVVPPDLQSTHPKALWDCQALPVALPEQRIESVPQFDLKVVSVESQIILNSESF